MVFTSANDQRRQTWIKKALRDIPSGARILDAGAGELRHKSLCTHLEYVSQDFAQYRGHEVDEGLQKAQWDSSQVDIVSDITTIPEPSESFHAILCSEVLEHVPDPMAALDELVRLLKKGGQLILTAPFASMVHFAPYHFCTGFSRYWYEYHLPKRGLTIAELSANGDWFEYCGQELQRLGGIERKYRGWTWPLAYLLSLAGRGYFAIRSKTHAVDLGCFGWHCLAYKN